MSNLPSPISHLQVRSFQLRASSGVFNLRVVLAALLCLMGGALTMLSFAATTEKNIVPVSNYASADAAAGWAIVPSPNANTTRHHYVNDVTCLSTADCWAVGYYYNESGVYRTLIERWDGTSWAIVESPNAIALDGKDNDNLLHSVTCVAASDCWAVGNYYIGIAYQTLIERWNGTSWTIVASPNTLAAEPNVLADVTCISASDCWAVGHKVGYSASGVTTQTLTDHWDGTSWTIVPSSNTSPTQSNFLQGVTCTSASDCWAVGSYRADDATFYNSLIQRWNGTSWAIVASPNVTATTYDTLHGVTCMSTSDCWTVGYYYTSIGPPQTLIERWNGTSWAIVASPNTLDDVGNRLHDVTCVSESDCWAVGQHYVPHPSNANQTLIQRWNGSSWTIVASPNTSTIEFNYLYRVTCLSPSDCWAVGNYFKDGTGVGQTLTMKYTASSPPVQLVGVASRKTHGGAGTFDVDLPLTGSTGIECRSGGATNDYTLVFTFTNPLTSVDSASVSSGSGSVVSSAIDTNDAHNYVVNLTGVTNAQVVTVSLSNVNDSAGNFNSVLSTSMSVLLGDTTANGSVNSSDIGQTKAGSGQTLINSNFRADVTADGSINSSDISTVKSKSGTALP